MAARAFRWTLSEVLLLKVLPIIFRSDDRPQDEELLEAAEAWLSAQLGRELRLKPSERAWVVVEREGERLKVRGLGTLRTTLDSMLHVDSETAGIKLYHRMQQYLEDQGLAGKEVLAYIEPEALGIWKGFLEAKEIKPANRWTVKIGE